MLLGHFPGLLRILVQRLTLLDAVSGFLERPNADQQFGEVLLLGARHLPNVYRNQCRRKRLRRTFRARTRTRSASQNRPFLDDGACNQVHREGMRGCGSKQQPRAWWPPRQSRNVPTTLVLACDRPYWTELYRLRSRLLAIALTGGTAC